MREAQDQDAIEPGTVSFSPPDYHLLVDAGPRVALSIDPPLHYSRPSIDVLFESAADLYGDRAVAVLLSRRHVLVPMVKCISLCPTCII